MVASYPINPENSTPSNSFGNQASDELGQITIWINSADFGEVAVSIDGENTGTITRFFNETPTCGQLGTLSIVRPPGTYRFKAQSASAVWEGDVAFTTNSCLMLEIGN